MCGTCRKRERLAVAIALIQRQEVKQPSGHGIFRAEGEGTLTLDDFDMLPREWQRLIGRLAVTAVIPTAAAAVDPSVPGMSMYLGQLQAGAQLLDQHRRFLKQLVRITYPDFASLGRWAEDGLTGPCTLTEFRSQLAPYNSTLPGFPPAGGAS